MPNGPIFFKWSNFFKNSLKNPEIQLTASSSQVMKPELSCTSSLGSAALKTGFIQARLYHMVGRGLQIASVSHILSTSSAEELSSSS